MGRKDLIELVGGDFAFLEDIALEEGSVDIFPLDAELVGQILVESCRPLAVHLGEPERGLRFGLAYARDTLDVLSRLPHLSELILRPLLQLRSILLISPLHHFNRLEPSVLSGRFLAWKLLNGLADQTSSMETCLRNGFIHATTAIWGHKASLRAIVERFHIVSIQLGEFLSIIASLPGTTFTLVKLLHLDISSYGATHGPHRLVDVAVETAIFTICGQAHFLLELRVKPCNSPRALHIPARFRIFNRGRELRNLVHDRFLDQAVVNHVLIVVRAQSPEEVYQRLAAELRC